MKALFTTSARVILLITLFYTLSNNAIAQKLTGAKKITDYTSLITMSATAEGEKVSFTGHTNAFAGVFTGTQNNTTVKFYCIDLNHNVSPSDHPVYWDEGATPAELTYLLNNYYPYNTANYSGKLSDNKEAAAVQLAIWHFSDNLNASSITDATIRTRTLAIIADATANAGNSNPLQTLQIIPATQTVQQGGIASFIVKAVSLNNTPISGLTIQLSTTGGTLSTASVTTNTNGESSVITLRNGTSIGTVTIKAKASVSIPQGTVYVAKIKPEEHQRIVLASPTSDVKEVTSVITFTQNQTTCDLSKFTTYTQGGWGSPSNSTPGRIRDQYFTSVFPNGLKVGGNYFIKLTSATAVMAYLPDGGTAVALTQSYTNPTDQINILAGQIVALSMNVKYSAAGYLGATSYPLGSLYIVGGTFSSKTVNQFLTIANNALGGANTGYSLSDINSAATAINENFDNGTANKGYLACSSACLNTIGSYVYRDTDYDGVKDSGEAGIAGVVVELLQGNALISSATTDANGSYSFTNVSNATYNVRLAASNFVSGGIFYNTNQIKWYTKGSSSINTTLNCNDNLSINFGYYKTCVTITKTANKQTAKSGDVITYTFTVENCGDVVLHGGVDVKDAMLGLDTNFVLQAGATATFTRKYTVKVSDCGNLVNIASAEGHPVLNYGTPSEKYLDDITDNSTFTVVVECKASLGDKVWLDTNKNGIQDNDESGFKNVTVKLYTCDGVLVTTTITDENGNYLFSNLTPGQYYVQFVKPSGYLFTNKDAATNDAVDSDADVTTGKTICTELIEGENDLTWDAGLYAEPVIEKADVKVEKSTSSLNPNCGDVVSYTIKVTNLGPNTATDVKVNDVLPAGLLYQSSSATVGSYNNTTGIWSVGTLSGNANETLTITVKVDCTSMNSTSFDLGAANGFNLFVLQDLNQPSSDTQGKVAVGHDATLSNYSVGDQLPANSGDVLIVGNDLNYTSGQVYSGNVVYGNSTNLPQYSVTINGSLSQGYPIDFAAESAYLQSLSTSLGNYTVNGSTTFQWGALSLTGSDPFLNVFKISGSDLSSANNLTINVPNGSVVLVNVDGTTISWMGGLVVNGTAINNVLYNFYQATNLTITGIDVRGSILATYADLNFQSGLISGQVIVKSMTGSGQFNNNLFQGNIPVDKVITNVAIVSSSTIDEVTNNNTSSATITIGSTTGNNNSGSTGGNTGGSTGGNSSGSWTNVCSFTQGQIIYTLLYDGGTIYAGTMGGMIYKSVDNGTTWTRINSGMNVGFIWSFVKNDSFIFAATENGVYKFNGSSWTLTSLSGKDVHALTVNNGIIYAGTWGFGIYKSVDNGTTWTETNSGIETFLTVQSLTVSNGTIFAGTVGGGLFKSTDGSTWTKAICGYQAIWALGSTSSAIFAGTYGDGIYKSVDGGLSFSKLSGLSVSFVYSIVSDASGKIFASSLTNGVFESSDNGATWSALGMGGYGVSALMVNPKTSDVYAGTKEGTVYKMSGSKNATGVENETGIPTEFKLAQNYPNPFNPSTTIEFSIPVAGSYSLKVYDILGQEVATLIDKNINAGYHKVNFDAGRMASGMYIYRLTGNNVNITKKMLLMK